MLCSKGEEVKRIWLQSCRQSFVKMLEDKKHQEAEETRAMAQISNAAATGMDGQIKVSMNNFLLS
jgi:coatomer subunit beta